jgi:hypothetical protein
LIEFQIFTIYEKEEVSVKNNSVRTDYLTYDHSYFSHSANTISDALKEIPYLKNFKYDYPNINFFVPGGERFIPVFINSKFIAYYSNEEQFFNLPVNKRKDSNFLNLIPIKHLDKIIVFGKFSGLDIFLKKSSDTLL